MSEILHWEERTIRKPHHCFECGKVYPASSQMVHAAYADGGSVDRCYWCGTCIEYMHRHFNTGDEIDKNEIYDNGPEGWNALKTELEGHK